MFKHVDKNFEGVIFRPATVCGYAPRQEVRFISKYFDKFCSKQINDKSFGGDQLRPNLHIKDYGEIVDILINAEKDKIQRQIFNVGYQNLSINEIAQLVKKVVEKEFPDKKEIKIIKTKSDDNRIISYKFR